MSSLAVQVQAPWPLQLSHIAADQNSLWVLVDIDILKSGGSISPPSPNRACSSESLTGMAGSVFIPVPTGWLHEPWELSTAASLGSCQEKENLGAAEARQTPQA